MIPFVKITHSSDDLSIELAHEIINNKLLFGEDADIYLNQQESFSPELVEGILIGISSGVATNYLTKLFDFIIQRFKRKSSYTTSVNVVFNKKIYIFPRDYKLLQSDLEKNSLEENSHTDNG